MKRLTKHQYSDRPKNSDQAMTSLSYDSRLSAGVGSDLSKRPKVADPLQENSQLKPEFGSLYLSSDPSSQVPPSELKSVIAAAVELALRGRGDLEIDRRWLSPSEAANYLGCTTQHLQMMRARRSGPSFVKFGRLVRYARTDLDDYLNARKITTKT